MLALLVVGFAPKYYVHSLQFYTMDDDALTDERESSDLSHAMHGFFKDLACT